MSTLFATSLVSSTTGDPRVDLHHDDKRFAQVSPDEARAWAHNILQAAEAADQDAFLVTFHREDCGLDPSHSMAVLHAYRVWRDKQRGGSDDDA